jgi:hypothetical protein
MGFCLSKIVKYYKITQIAASPVDVHRVAKRTLQPARNEEQCMDGFNIKAARSKLANFTDHRERLTP